MPIASLRTRALPIERSQAKHRVITTHFVRQAVIETLEQRKLLAASAFNGPGPISPCAIGIDENGDYIQGSCLGDAVQPTQYPPICGVGDDGTGPAGSGGGGGGGGGGPAGGDDGSTDIPEPIPLYSPSAASDEPVRFFDGLPIIGTSDLRSDSSGLIWGHSRSWRGTKTASHNGQGWYILDAPRLEWATYEKVYDSDPTFGGGNLIRKQGRLSVIVSGGNRVWFEYSQPTGASASFTPLHQENGSFEIDSSSGDWIYRTKIGTETRFYEAEDPSGADVLSGMMKSFTAAGGSKATATYITSGSDKGKMSNVLIKDAVGNDLEKLTYTYFSGTNRLSAVEMGVANGSGGFTAQRTATYVYYGTGSSNGPSGSLKLVQIHDGNASADVIESKYYRYTSQSGNVLLLKTVVEGAAFDRMATAVPSYDSASDADIRPYVDHEFVYKKALSGTTNYGLNTKYQVVEEVAGGEGCSACAGGQGRYGYDYEFNSDSTVAGSANYDTSDYNIWRVKTTEYLPDLTNDDVNSDGFVDASEWADNDRNVVYTNEHGQVLAKVYQEYDGTTLVNEFATVYRYDDAGRLLMIVNPSAMKEVGGQIINEAYPDLINYSAGSATHVQTGTGLVRLYDWYDGSDSSDDNATASVAGGVLGYVASESISHGLSPTASTVLLVEQTYFRKSAGGDTTILYGEVTRYRDETGTDPVTASFDYTFHSGTTQILKTTVSVDEAETSQNGPGSTANEQRTTWKDEQGRVVWSRDEGGFLHFNGYDITTGSLVLSVTDADTVDDTGDSSDLFSTIQSDSRIDNSVLSLGATRTASSNALDLRTGMTVDKLGRTVTVTDPNGNVTWLVYNDADYEVRTYRGWNVSTGTTTGPVQVQRQVRGATAYDHDGDGWNHGDAGMGTAPVGTVFNETITYSGTLNLNGTAGSYSPAGTESLTSVTLESLSRSITNESGQAVQLDRYFNLSGITYSTTSAELGISSTDSSTGNRHESFIAYDDRGRREVTTDANGTITWNVFDGQGRLLSTFVGTDGTGGKHGDPQGTNSSNDLLPVASYEYDNGGAGDGNLTKSTQHVDTNASNDRVSLYDYDWRNRSVLTRSGVGSTNVIQHQYSTYDNFNRVVTTERFGAGTNVGTWPDANSDGVPDSPLSSTRSHKTETFYDDRDRVYRQVTYSVDPSTGSVDDGLSSYTWYDARSNVIKSEAPGGLVTKHTYDGAGRRVLTSLTDGGGDTAYAHAHDTVGDIVLEESHTFYDDASNVIQSTSKMRFHDALDSQTGALGNTTTSPKARVSHVTTYYDAANRPKASANYGTNGGSAFTRPGSVAARSDTVLVSSTIYDSAGRVFSQTDPRNIQTRFAYDDLGRRITLTEAYVDGTPSDADDRITRWTYNGNGDVLTMTADLPSGQDDQVTHYNYNVSTVRGDAFNSKSILAHTDFPNLTGDSKEHYLNNRLGQRIELHDRNGTEHGYAYDLLGRMTADTVTTLGTGVDGTIRRITTDYNDEGRVQYLTSHTTTSGSGNEANQIERTYNGLGQLVEEHQEHTGLVDVDSPSVAYAYSEMDDGSANFVNHSRLESMAYPNGEVLTYRYGINTATAIDDRISRLTALEWDGKVQAAMTYLGLSTVAQRGMSQNIVGGIIGTETLPSFDIQLSYYNSATTGEGGDAYVGLDRFGRLVDHEWTITFGRSTPATADHFAYGYDRSGNRLYEENLLDTTKSELYHGGSGYDALSRLTSFERGTLNAAKDAIPGTASRSQAWSLDALGNWDTLTQDGSTQTRNFDEQNKITAISGLGATATPTYSGNGEMTGDETGQSLAYDAWGRLVEVDPTTSAGDEITYAYDAAGRRITDGDESLYYSSQWQVLEVRDVSGTAVEHYVWSPVYIDALMLRDRDTTGDGTLNERLYTLSDANFNITALISSSGEVAERYLYDPYGTRTVLDANWSTDVDGQSDYDFRYGHQGGRHYLAAGLVHFRNRDLDTSLGRWVQQDPLMFEDGANSYLAFLSMPILLVDPNGTTSISPNSGLGDDATFSPDPEATKKINWCRVRYRANGPHVGIEIDAGDAGKYMIDGTGGINGINVRDRSESGFNKDKDAGKRGDWKFISNRWCACMLGLDGRNGGVSTLDKWRNQAKKYLYLLVTQNSNWSLACLAKRCGIKISHGQFAPGWNNWCPGKPKCDAD